MDLRHVLNKTKINSESEKMCNISKILNALYIDLDIRKTEKHTLPRKISEEMQYFVLFILRNKLL